MLHLRPNNYANRPHTAQPSAKAKLKSKLKSLVTQRAIFVRGRYMRRARVEVWGDANYATHLKVIRPLSALLLLWWLRIPQLESGPPSDFSPSREPNWCALVVLSAVRCRAHAPQGSEIFHIPRRVVDRTPLNWIATAGNLLFWMMPPAESLPIFYCQIFWLDARGTDRQKYDLEIVWVFEKCHHMILYSP